MGVIKTKRAARNKKISLEQRRYDLMVLFTLGSP